jgi:hypothetical protein
MLAAGTSRLLADFVVKVADEDGADRRSADFERSAVLSVAPVGAVAVTLRN